MSRKILVILLIFQCLALVSFSFNTDLGYPEYLQKKIDRILKKSFNKELPIAKKISSDKLSDTCTAFQLFGSQADSLGFCVIQTNTGCKLGGCMGIEAIDKNESYETFYCMTIYDTSGVIMQVHILEYEGKYGYEISAKSWLKQFKKNDVEVFQLGKNIDAISGATISANSMVTMINNQKELIQNLINSL